MTEQLVAEIATRLCGPHSRERLFRCKRLINKFNSTGTFRRHFGQVPSFCVRSGVFVRLVYH